MATSAATTVAEYLAELSPDRRAALTKVRGVIRKHLPRGYQETMQYGMISYVIPLARLPDTYNGKPFAIASLASQKQYMALYLIGVYSHPPTSLWFRAAYKASGKKLDMGKACVRFKTVHDLPLDVVGQAIARFGVDDMIARLSPARSARTTRSAAKTSAAKTSAAKTSAAKTPIAKKPVARRA